MKNLQNLGKTLNKQEQQAIVGSGGGSFCGQYRTSGECDNNCNSTTHECQIYFCSPPINGQGVGYNCVSNLPPKQ